MIVAYANEFKKRNPGAIREGTLGFKIGDYTVYVYPKDGDAKFIDVKNLKDQKAIYALMKSKNKKAKPINTADQSITVPFDANRIIDDIEKYMNTKMNLEIDSKFKFNEADRSSIISVIERAIHRIKIKKDENAKQHAGNSDVQTFTTHGVTPKAELTKSDRLKAKDLLDRIAALKFIQ